MREALQEAAKAEAIGEVPIGAVVVFDGDVIGRGHNRRECDQQGSAHAEMIAIEEACRTIGSWRLEECTIYVTLEPCPMCAGAIIQSRIDHVVFAAWDPKAGCCGTLMNLVQDERFNHQASLSAGVLEEESAEMLRQFFRGIRQKKKEAKRRETESNLFGNRPDDE
ncbi:tRNA-specific adenosine deaminase [Alkalicoccus urumqiensis]|uniref:tRNA-specific adenosine deaminase n=2 Tax=Alkalicoccus urumqiensis TaxID=1548213 RepID=A0A2P6MD47_ALKUR|nr:tRNA-specific adenosine deaminase [Alkalicoccus urumqiensis]